MHLREIVRFGTSGTTKQFVNLKSFQQFHPATVLNRARICRFIPSASYTNGNGSKPYYGPPRPPKATEPQPAQERLPWVQDLIDDAPHDDEVADLLEGTDYDPDKIREKMRESMKRKHQQIYGLQQLGSDRMVRIKFREVDPVNLWVWFELYSVPSAKELELLQTMLWSWFVVGKFGGYNAMNMQLFQKGDDESSYFEYDHDEGEETMDSFIHEMQTLETQGEWARFWVDLGTADEMALDVLINMVTNFSQQTLGIKSFLIGGENEDWEIPVDHMSDQNNNPLEMARNMYNKMGP